MVGAALGAGIGAAARARVAVAAAADGDERQRARMIALESLLRVARPVAADTVELTAQRGAVTGVVGHQRAHPAPVVKGVLDVREPRPFGGYWDQRGSMRQGGTVWVSLSGQE